MTEASRRTPPAPGDDDASRRADAIRAAARRQWSHDPAGAVGAVDERLGSRQSFAEIERYRYAEQPWMHETFQFERFRGQRVLEIGVGLGSDHLQFARAGALMTGIDLTPRCIELTAERFAQQGLTSDLRVMDAEALEFADDSFDAVYSFGVLHHIPSTERAFAEVRRVLRPGGVFIGGLYNRRSLFIAVSLLTRLVSGSWRRESLHDRLAQIEHSTDDGGARPYVRLFDARELRQALTAAGFVNVEIRRRHFGVKINRPLPPRMVDLVSRSAGWYLIHQAT